MVYSVNMKYGLKHVGQFTLRAICLAVEGRTESREQLFFLHANWEKQTKESAVVGGTSCCVILECLVTSVACIT